MDVRRRQSGDPRTVPPTRLRWRGLPLQPAQSTATLNAAQIWRIRRSLRRPNRCVSVPTETLSIASRFTAEAWGMGSSDGSRRTSLGRPRMVVVQGAMIVRRSLGMATSRDNTTTGRRATSGSSHHQTSPRAGRAVTTARRLRGTRRGHPTRRARQADERRTPCRRRRFERRDVGRGAPRGLHRAGRHRCCPGAIVELPRGVTRPPSC